MKSVCPIKRLIVLSECSKEYAENRVPKTMCNIPVDVLSWKDIYQYTKTAYSDGTNAEKRLLLELNTYLGGADDNAKEGFKLGVCSVNCTRLPKWMGYFVERYCQ